MIFLLLIIGLIYVPAICWLIFGALRLPRYQTSDVVPVNKFSILIPFRNEENQLPDLLASLEKLAYPRTLFEVIFVNDASEDEGEHIIKLHKQTTDLSMAILQNKRKSNSPKKDAILTAITNAAHDWIVTTDADCVLPINWLAAYDQIIREEVPMMVCGPVVYPNGKRLVEQFQFLDGLSLQGATLGSFGWKHAMLCNGANLAYQKSVFEAVEGFASNDHIASGDDIFLLEKVQLHYPNTTYYLNNKDAVVRTKSEQSWSQVVQQRIRWASKTTQQKNPSSKILGIIVFLGNLVLLTSIFVSIWTSGPLYLLWIILGLKITVDLSLIRLTSHFLGKPFSFVQFILIAVVYPPIVLWIIVNSLSGSYNWKGRTFKK